MQGPAHELPPRADVLLNRHRVFRRRHTNGGLESDFSGHLREHADHVRAWVANG